MSMMWKGPSRALKATFANPIAVRLHRRAGEQHIAYDLDYEGRSAQVYRLTRHVTGIWVRSSAGTVTGGDPMNTIINVSLALTKHDAELFALIAQHITERTDEITADLRRLDSVLEEVEDTLSLAVRSVRS
jgi:hypothetical protein